MGKLNLVLIGVALLQGGGEDLICEETPIFFSKSTAQVYKEFALGKHCQFKFDQVSSHSELLKAVKKRLNEVPSMEKNTRPVFASYSKSTYDVIKSTPLNQTLIAYTDAYISAQEGLHFFYFHQLANLEAISYSSRNTAMELMDTFVNESETNYYKQYNGYKSALDEIKYLVMNATLKAQEDHNLLSEQLSEDALYARSILMKYHGYVPKYKVPK